MSVSACYQIACCCHPYYSIPRTILCGLTRALVSPLRYFKSRHFRCLRVGQCHSFFHRNKRKPKRMHSLLLVHLQILFTSKTYRHLCHYQKQPNGATVIIGWFFQKCDTYCHNNRQGMLGPISNAKTKSSTMAASPFSILQHRDPGNRTESSSIAPSKRIERNSFFRPRVTGPLPIPRFTCRNKGSLSFKVDIPHNGRRR